MVDEKSYRQIVKTTGLFGGVEIVRILVGIIQTKVVAVLLGPAGVGIQNLFNTALHMLTSFFGFGLQTSAVREIAQAKGTGDGNVISKTIITLRRWVSCTAVAGAILMIALSSQLSQWTFGTSKYSFEFILLSLALVFTLISNGQIALIKGLRRLKDLAKASLLGSVLSLIVSVPLFYIYGEKAIVPVLIITALSLLCCSWFYARRIRMVKVTISYSESFQKGKEMFKIGFFLMLSSFLMQLASFLINSFITHNGTIDDVGYYRAGFLITAHYVGLIFTAMGADFLPRLSEVNADAGKMRTIVIQQTEVAALIIAPMVALLFPLSRLMINVLYSPDFYVIEPFICWAALGLVARAGVWCLSYLMLANGLSKDFFVSELFGNATNVGLCIWGYYLWGISGLGIAFMLNNLLCLVFNYYLVWIHCKFTYDWGFLCKMLLLNAVIVVMFLVYVIIHNIFVSVAIALPFCWYCLDNLQNRMGINILKRFKK